MRNHGTRAKYTIERCRCDRCRTAHREYNRQWDRRQRRASYGLEDHNPAYIDASEAIAHIHWLRSKGVGKRTIAKAAGIGITKTSLDKVHTIWTELVRQTDPWHGTYYGYARKNCRCIRCRKVMRDYTAERRAAS